MLRFSAPMRTFTGTTAGLTVEQTVTFYAVKLGPVVFLRCGAFTGTKNGNGTITIAAATVPGHLLPFDVSYHALIGVRAGSNIIGRFVITAAGSLIYLAETANGNWANADTVDVLPTTIPYLVTR